MEAEHSAVPQFPKLKIGDTVAVITSGSAVEDEGDIEAACAWLENQGFKPKPMPNLNANGIYTAGNAALRASDFNDAVHDDEVRGIMELRGGCGSAQIIELIDFDAFKSNPKVFVGFSDITSLHLALQKFTNVVTYHGPTLTWLIGEKSHPYTSRSLLQQILEEGGKVVIVPIPEVGNAWTVVGGQAEGPLVGGNITLVCESLGTPYEIDTKGRILFLEDWNCEPWVLLNCFTQLKNAGKLNAAAGIVIGVEEGVEANSEKPTYSGNMSFKDLVIDCFRDSKCPVLYGLPIGHTNIMATLPYGANAILDSNKQTLTICEPSPDQGALR